MMSGKAGSCGAECSCYWDIGLTIVIVMEVLVSTITITYQIIHHHTSVVKVPLGVYHQYYRSKGLHQLLIHI